MEVLFSLLIFHRALIIIWDDLILIVVNLKPSLVWSRSQSLLRSRCFNGTVKKDLWDLISSYLFSIVQNASLPSTLRNWFIASVLFFFRFSWLWDIILCLVIIFMKIEISGLWRHFHVLRPTCPLLPSSPLPLTGLCAI